MSKRVLIATRLDETAKQILERHGRYTVVQAAEPLPDLAKQYPDTYALIVRSEKVTAEILDLFPALKVVIRAGSGFNTIDVKHARRKGIDVMTTPGANANAVAEEVVALMLADARHLVQADASLRAGKWEKSAFMGREISGRTLGIVGLGAIGRLLARRLSGFEMKVLAYDPFCSKERARDLGVQLVSLPELFEQSDFVSLHIPENKETRGLINASLLERMRPGATLINCARAGVIVEADLRKAKAERGLRFLNDVYEKDEPGTKSVADIADIMLPHLGASTLEANLKAAQMAAEQLIDYDEKGTATFIVNRDVPLGLDKIYGDLAFLLARLCRQLLGPDAALKSIETSFYGSLKPFSDWLPVPIVAALSDDFDRSMDGRAAMQYLREMGVDYVNREASDQKGYANSITVDLTGCLGAQKLVSASVRGTVAESHIMIARINDFDRLYYEPRGHTLLFTYLDRPGVVGQIGAALARAEINIDDMRNPHDPTGQHSIAVLRVNRPVPDEVLHCIRDEIEAQVAVYIHL